MKTFFGKYDLTLWKLPICSQLLKKSLMENLTFYAVLEVFKEPLFLTELP